MRQGESMSIWQVIRTLAVAIVLVTSAVTGADASSGIQLTRSTIGFGSGRLTMNGTIVCDAAGSVAGNDNTIEKSNTTTAQLRFTAFTFPICNNSLGVGSGTVQVPTPLFYSS